MIVAWTGHRPDIFRDADAASNAVRVAATDLVKREGARQFVVGGQRGVDTWAALAALELGLAFTLILPIEPTSFAVDWTPQEHAALDRLIANASEVRMAAGFTDRNQQVVAAADLLVAVWTGALGGGTAETIGFAQALGRPVREILLEPAPDAGSAGGRGI